MTDTVVAVAVIPVEQEVDGVMTYYQFEPGAIVRGHGVTKELIEVLRANGSVAEPPATLPDVVAEKEELESRVAELTKQLEEAKAASKSEANKASGPVTSGNVGNANPPKAPVSPSK